MADSTKTEALLMTVQIVSAFVSNNRLETSDLPDLIETVHTTVQSLTGEQDPANTQEPAVPITESIQKDYLVCLEDGRELKMLKRYLRSRYDLTPDEYRKKWGLPSDYPMVAPNYAKLRSAHAKEIGLGKNKG